MVTDIEGALRRETRQRRQAERVLRSQSAALAKTLELLVRTPELPDFMNSLLRVINSQCGGLWATFWVVDERTGEASRKWIQWRDETIGRSVEAFAQKHTLLMRRLGRLYREMIQADGVTMLVPAEDLRVSPVVRRFYRKIGASGALLVPLKLGRQLLGWITHQAGDSMLAPEQVAFIEGMAQQAALAFHLTRLATAKHEAECALEDARLAREQAQEHLAIGRLLHVNARDPADRLGAVLRGSLENASALLRGHWAILWRNDGDLGVAMPAWIDFEGTCTRVSMEMALEISKSCRSTHRVRFDKWCGNESIQVECAGSQRMRDLLVKMGGPPPGKRCAKLIYVPMWFNGESLGFMLVLTENLPDKSSERHVAVKALATQAALVLALDEMSSVQRSAALAEERNRIARDLHDLLAQSFTGIVLQVEAMRAECPGLPGVVVERLEKIRTHSGRSAEELRRTLSMLRPTALDRCLLPEALAMLARETELRSNVKVRFLNRADSLQFPARMEQHIYAIVTEGLQNALSHAKPTRITVSLEIAHEELIVRVINDGILAKRETGVGPPRPRHGLSNIRERASEMGAHFSLRTLRGKTRLEVAAPLDRLISNNIQ